MCFQRQGPLPASLSPLPLDDPRGVLQRVGDGTRSLLQVDREVAGGEGGSFWNAWGSRLEVNPGKAGVLHGVSPLGGRGARRVVGPQDWRGLQGLRARGGQPSPCPSGLLSLPLSISGPPAVATVLFCPLRIITIGAQNRRPPCRKRKDS